MTNITTPKQITKTATTVWMLIGAIICGVGGALLVGEIIFTGIRIFLELSEENYDVLILPIILLTISFILGTVILIMAVFIENNKMKTAVILFSVGLPIIIEIVDISIRGYILINDIMTKMI